MDYLQYIFRNELKLFSQFEDNEKKLKQKIRRQANAQDDLKLYLAALIKLLLDKKMITPQELAECITEVDRMDGFEDGRADVELTPGGPACESPSLPETGQQKAQGDIGELADMIEGKDILNLNSGFKK